MKPRIHLVTRADDAGGCRSANEAILECVEAGIIKNVSFMAVGPAIEHAAELLGGRDDIAYGLHVCLNAEWEAVKWKPLTEDPKLCDGNGDFLAFPSDTKATLDGKAFDFGWEVFAQRRRLRELGLNVSYVDEHMGVSWISPDLRGAIAGLCSLHGLLDAAAVPSLPDGDTLEARLKAAMGERYVWVTHPGKVAPDMNAFYLAGGKAGVVAQERDAERRLLLDPRLPELFQKWRVKATRYDELRL